MPTILFNDYFGETMPANDNGMRVPVFIGFCTFAGWKVIT